MTRKGYILEASGKCAEAIYNLTMAIPCIIRRYEIGKYIELELEVRNEDLACVERRLASFV